MNRMIIILLVFLSGCGSVEVANATHIPKHYHVTFFAANGGAYSWDTPKEPYRNYGSVFIELDNGHDIALYGSIMIEEIPATEAEKSQ